MRGESWAFHMVMGLCIAGAGAFFTAQQLEERRDWQRLQEQPVIELPVAESLAPPGAPPRRVRLTDLVVECDRMISVDGHVYAPAHGAQWRDHAIVEVAPGEDCETTATRAHQVDPAPLELGEAVFASRAVSVPGNFVRARPQPPEPGIPGIAIAAILVGLVWLLRALGMRREYRAGLAEAMARAAAPRRSRSSAEATSGQGPYRGEAATDTWLPRPLKLRSRELVEQRRRGIVATIAAWSLAAITLGYVGHAGHAQWLEQQRWEAGIAAREVSASGDVRSHAHGLFQSGSVRYVYYDLQRRPHVGERSFSMLLGSTLRGTDFEVRFDPDDPTQHAIGWTGEDTGPVWMALLSYAAIGLLLAGGSFVAGRRALQTPRRWRALLENPEEIELVVTSRVVVMHRGSATGAVEFTFAVPGSDRPFEYRAIDPSHCPFFLDLDQTRALGLRNPKQPGAVMVLCADLSPLEVEPGVEQEIRARAKEARKADR